MTIPQAHSAEGAQLPFAGYDRLDARHVNDGLSDHSQVELGASRATSGLTRTGRPCSTSCATYAGASRSRATTP